METIPFQMFGLQKSNGKRIPMELGFHQNGGIGFPSTIQWKGHSIPNNIFTSKNNPLEKNRNFGKKLKLLLNLDREEKINGESESKKEKNLL